MDGEVIEDAIRRHLGLDVLERLWAQNDMEEEDAMALAAEGQKASRSKARRR